MRTMQWFTGVLVMVRSPSHLTPYFPSIPITLFFFLLPWRIMNTYCFFLLLSRYCDTLDTVFINATRPTFGSPRTDHRSFRRFFIRRALSRHRWHGRSRQGNFQYFSPPLILQGLKSRHVGMGLPQLCVPSEGMVASLRTSVSSGVEPTRCLGRRFRRDSECAFAVAFTLAEIDLTNLFLPHLAVDIHFSDHPITPPGPRTSTSIPDTPPPLWLQAGVSASVRTIPGCPCNWLVTIFILHETRHIILWHRSCQGHLLDTCSRSW